MIKKRLLVCVILAFALSPLNSQPPKKRSLSWEDDSSNEYNNESDSDYFPSLGSSCEDSEKDVGTKQQNLKKQKYNNQYNNMPSYNVTLECMPQLDASPTNNNNNNNNTPVSFGEEFYIDPKAHNAIYKDVDKKGLQILNEYCGNNK